MKMPNRAAMFALGAVALLAAFGTAGCGDKASSEGTSGEDALKHMGGPPPGRAPGGGGNMPPGRGPGGPGGPGGGGTTAPPGPQGAAPGGTGR